MDGRGQQSEGSAVRVRSVTVVRSRHGLWVVTTHTAYDAPTSTVLSRSSRRSGQQPEQVCVGTACLPTGLSLGHQQATVGASLSSV